MCMAAQRREHDGNAVAFRSDKACIGLKVTPRARSDSTLTLTQEKRKRERMSSAMTSSNTLAVMVAVHGTHARSGMDRAVEVKWAVA
jgi:hypothetical protein